MATILRVRTTLTYGSGGPGLHTSYWLPGTSGGVTADATDAVARVRAFFNSISANFATTFSSLVQTEVAQISDQSGALLGGLTAATVAAVVGTGGGAQGPIAAMSLARLRTGLVVNGRALKGRWYLGPVSTGAISTTGTFPSAAQTIVNNAGATMLGAGPTTTALAVWHRPQGGNLGSSTAVTSISAWDQMAVLRSRRDA